MADLHQDVLDWTEVVAPEFDFLRQHGFRPAPELGFTNPTGVRTVYATDETAIGVQASEEFERVGVVLARLEHGRMPPTPLWVADDSEEKPIDEVLLGVVIAMRAPRVWEATQAASGLSPADIQKQLTIWAELLRRFVPEFLEGDTGAIDEAERMIRRVAREHRVAPGG